MPRNILFFMTDQHRSDYVGYIDSGKTDTPNIDRIAEGTYFTNCTTSNPICTPARTSLITGRYSRQIGMLAMSGDFDPQIPTFMQSLQKNGYKTYGIGKYHYMHLCGVSTKRGCGYDHVAMSEEMKRLGYDFVWETAGKQNLIPDYCFYADYLNRKGLLNKVRDFYAQSGGINGDTPDHNYDRANPWPFSEEDYIDVVTARIAKEQLEQHPCDKPFYMYVSFCGPHKVYDAPQRYLDMYEYEENDDFIPEDGFSMTEEEKHIIYRQRRSYKAMIRLIDDQIGEILKVLDQKGLTDDTLILFASDHGDMLGDHYRIQKGVPWEGASNVPLAISLPGYKNNRCITRPVQLMDIAATILDYAGIDPTEGLSRKYPAYNDRIPAKSLIPVLKGETDSVRDWTYCESDMTEEAPDSDFNEVYKKRGANGRRSNDWRMIKTENSKYIKYLGYEDPGDAYEEFYDLKNDPNELENLIGRDEYIEDIQTARSRMEYVLDKYPTVQLAWASKFADHRTYH